MLTILLSTNFWIGFAVGFIGLLVLLTIAYFILKWAYDDIPTKKHNASYESYSEFIPTAFD